MEKSDIKHNNNEILDYLDPNIVKNLKFYPRYTNIIE